MAKPTMVRTSASNGSGHAAHSPHTGGSTVSPTSTHQKTRTPGSTTSGGLEAIRGALQAEGVSGTAAKLVLSAWRPSTLSQYRQNWERWLSFCGEREVPPLSAPVQVVIQFLTRLFERGLGYSSVNSARCAVIALITTCTDSTVVANSPLLAKFMKGVFNSRPSLPRSEVTWDVSAVLHHLHSMFPLHKLNLYFLSVKLATL